MLRKYALLIIALGFFDLTSSWNNLLLQCYIVLTERLVTWLRTVQWFSEAAFTTRSSSRINLCFTSLSKVLAAQVCARLFGDGLLKLNLWNNSLRLWQYMYMLECDWFCVRAVLIALLWCWMCGVEWSSHAGLALHELHKHSYTLNKI